MFIFKAVGTGVAGILAIGGIFLITIGRSDQGWPLILGSILLALASIFFGGGGEKDE